MIVVTGVSGAFARLAVRQLLHHVDAADIVGTTRTPAQAADLPIAVRPTDFTDPDALARTFDGADTLLLVSLPLLDDRAQLQQNAIDAAVKAGIGHVVYTSFTRAAEPDNPVLVVPEHRLAEQALGASGLTYTALRFNMWTEMLLLLVNLRWAVKSGSLYSNSGAGGVAHVTKADSAAVAAAVAAGGLEKDQIVEVSGPSAVSDPQLAEVLSSASGRRIDVRPASDDELIANLITGGVGADLARLLAKNGHARRDGWYSATSDAVRRLTGHEPTSVPEFLAAHQAELLGG